MKYASLVAGSILLSISLVGCPGEGQRGTSLREEQNAARSRLGAQMKEAANTARTYHAMDNATLLTRLVEQSASLKEPFNSLAYRELKTRKDVDMNALASLVKENPNPGGLLPLLLLRRVDRTAYIAVPAELRAKVLTESLQASKMFNTWGLPNFYLEDASNALIESGQIVVPELSRMLNDCRPAPLFGSEEAMLSQLYKYRLCDYALFFLKRIAGDERFKLPKTPEERDALIGRTGK